MSAGTRPAPQKVGWDEKCPVCGKKWIRRCRRNEWGYYYDNSFSNQGTALTLLCSGPCSRQYAEMRLKKSALKFARTKAWRFLQLYRSGLSKSEIARREGMLQESVYTLIEDAETLHFKEIEWLDQHPGEISA